MALRLEGPYFSPADPSRYDVVVCLVAGTGVSGALAIAAAFTESRGKTVAKMSRVWQKCVVIWSLKATEDVDLPFWGSSEGLEVHKYLTGPGLQRVNLDNALENARSGSEKGGDKMWVYISGPNAFIAAAEEACKVATGPVDFYAASWDI